MDRVVKTDLENMLHEVKPGEPDSYVKQWYFHVYGGDRKDVYVSPYNFDTEESVLRAASVYIKQRMPRGEAWTTMVSHE